MLAWFACWHCGGNAELLTADVTVTDTNRVEFDCPVCGRHNVRYQQPGKVNTLVLMGARTVTPTDEAIWAELEGVL